MLGRFWKWCMWGKVHNLETMSVVPYVETLRTSLKPSKFPEQSLGSSRTNLSTNIIYRLPIMVQF